MDNCWGCRWRALRSDGERNQRLRDRAGDGDRPRSCRPAHHQPPGRPRPAVLARLADAARAPTGCCARTRTHPQLPYLRDAGIAVEETAPTAEDLVDACAGGRTVVVVADGRGRPGPHRRPGPPGRLRPRRDAGPGAAPRLLRPARRPPPRPRPGDGPHPRASARGRAAAPTRAWRSTASRRRTNSSRRSRRATGTSCARNSGTSCSRSSSTRVSPRTTRRSPFSIDDVAGGIVDETRSTATRTSSARRRPTTPEDVKAHWLRTKAEEKRRTSVTEGVPLGQPALALAAKLASRVRTAGLDVPLPAGDGHRLRAAGAGGTRGGGGGGPGDGTAGRRPRVPGRGAGEGGGGRGPDPSDALSVPLADGDVEARGVLSADSDLNPDSAYRR